MKVLSMALTNIKRYRGTTVFESLTPGVLLLLGRNGCGKSTLPQSIGLSVFGAIPAEFRNSAGKGLVGFVNRQERSGGIRAVVEVRPGRILTFDTHLKVLPLNPKKPEQLDPSNEVRTSIYVGAQPLEGDLPKATALHQSLPIAGIAALIKEELGSREKGDVLYGTLLSPSQSGGLTAYLSETPKKRQDQTERILGLQSVKKVGEVLRELCKERRAAVTIHQDQLRDALTAAAEHHEALAPLLESHGATDVPFEALTAGEIHAAGTSARAPLIQTVAERAGAVVGAQRALERTTALADSLRALSQAARTLVEQLVARDTAQKEVTDGEAAVKEAAALAEDAARWQKANALVETLTAKIRERDKGLAALERLLGEARKDLKHLDDQAVERTKEQERLDEEEAEEKKGLDGLNAAFADWPDRQARNAEEIAALDAAGRDLAVLRELLAACADLGDLDAPQDKLGRLQEALGQGRLPDDARGLVDTIADQLDAVSKSETPTSTAANDQLIHWEDANVRALGAARAVAQKLTREKADVETAQRTFDKNTQRRAARREALKGEDARGQAKREAAEAAIAKHTAEHQVLVEAHAGLDEALAEARSTRDDPALVDTHKAWVIATSRAASLPAHRAALQAAQATVQTALSAFTALSADEALPEDTEGWRRKRDELQARERDAQDARVAATAALGETHSALEDAQGGINALESTLEGVCRQRAALEERRANHRELQTLLDAVISPLPRCVASRVVERVSSLANDFFQELFVQPSEPASVSWQAADYEVRLTRGGESIPAKHASGGEKMAIGISLNLALIHYMAPEVRWLVLDEPTASLDEENRAGLRDVVERLREPMDDGQRLFDQLLFISHESALFEGLGESLDFAAGEDG